MKSPTLRACAWCETNGPADTHCHHCGVEFPTIRHEDLPKPPPADRYSAEQREAFKQLNVLTAMEGSR